MMLQLLHGPAKVASRSRLLEIKKKFDQNNIVVFEQGADLKNILDNLSSQSLFEEKKLIILENPSEEFINYPKSDHKIIFWFDHEVSLKKPILNFIKDQKGEILNFPEGREVSVFPFLDFLAANDKRAFLELQKLKQGGFEIQYFITMVFYLLRNLAVTPKTAPPFVKQKLERQRKNFDLEKIKKLYKEILELDFKIKSGLLEKDQAEFLLVNIFTENPAL